VGAADHEDRLLQDPLFFVGLDGFWFARSPGRMRPVASRSSSSKKPAGGVKSRIGSSVMLLPCRAPEIGMLTSKGA
jgi:hypothetical protein